MESGVRFESLKKNYEQTVRKEKIKGTRIGGKKKKRKEDREKKEKDEGNGFFFAVPIDFHVVAITGGV